VRRKTIQYSEAFKRQVVDEISRGKYTSLNAAMRAYGIRGTTTIERWVRQFGDERVLAQRIRVETMTERNELKEARKRIRDLEATLATTHMDLCLEEAFLEIACEKMGTTPAELKKKNALTLSAARKLREGQVR
jgi:transposase